MQVKSVLQSYPEAKFLPGRTPGGQKASSRQPAYRKQECCEDPSTHPGWSRLGVYSLHLSEQLLCLSSLATPNERLCQGSCFQLTTSCFAKVAVLRHLASLGHWTALPGQLFSHDLLLRYDSSSPLGRTIYWQCQGRCIPLAKPAQCLFLISGTLEAVRAWIF